jgi:hypothetical protein
MPTLQARLNIGRTGLAAIASLNVGLDMIVIILGNKTYAW